MDAYITGLNARSILDSRGNPTVEVDCFVNGALAGRAAVPSGASTGSHEAVELRDGGKRWMGKGVDNAVQNVIEKIQDALVGLRVDDQTTIDQCILDLDDSPNKANIGANATLGASMACLHAGANVHSQPLWRYIGGLSGGCLPVPLMNILNGGAHAASDVDVQEFMVVPHGFDSYSEALRAGVETYHSLKSVLKEQGLLGGIGDEGGFAPNLPSNETGLSLLSEAIERAGYSPGDELGIALDVAAQEFLHDDGYHIDGEVLSGENLVETYARWADEHPIISIEDPFGEDDWSSWSSLTREIGDRVQIVGDDLFVTNVNRLSDGIERRSANAILIKPNQIGTITETLECIEMAKSNGLGTIMSHRSGETSDDTIADLAVGARTGQIKTGAPARSDRTSKYNQLLRISETCGEFLPPF
ncbi:MAG: phosphopyruvate hydratase [Candidatus Thermoplasmatota archaeon]|nr:phosphopyruvate hydratase [Candidatus Thermoplasmatota archaeon]MEC8721052.1 phosphopyruvate hydratase [Candidatus Thermoplasmatota archaeon]